MRLVVDYHMTVQELQKLFLPTVAPEDFFLLLVHATGKEKVFLLAHPEYELPTEAEKKAREFLARRLKHEPVAYITGHKEFYGRDFHVTRDTLIPRPETELMIEQVLTLFHTNTPLSQADIIDLGTGSGNIIITLAKEIERIHQVTGTGYYALDISPQALDIAKKNARAHDIEKQISFIKSNLLQNFPLPQEKNRHAVIVANLPYLSSEIYQASSLDVRDHEPHSALESGADGLDHYRRLLQELAERKNQYQSISFLLEISPEQSTSLRAMIAQTFPKADIGLFQDLAGKDRLIQTTL